MAEVLSVNVIEMSSELPLSIVYSNIIVSWNFIINVYLCSSAINWNITLINVYLNCSTYFQQLFIGPFYFQALILIGRAVNIYPLSFISNYFRDHKITPKQQFIMWFSGTYI